MIDIEKDIGFVILLTELRTAGIYATAKTIESNFGKTKHICVVPEYSKEEALKPIKNISNIVKGGETISSLINTGIKESKKDWNLIVMAGNIIRYKPVSRYKQWVQSKKDILYRATNTMNWKWEDSSLHGLLMHKEALQEVGDFPEEKSLQFCKLLWGDSAIKKGYKLKGLVGIKLF